MALEWISALPRLKVVGSGSLKAAIQPAVSGIECSYCDNAVAM